MPTMLNLSVSIELALTGVLKSEATFSLLAASEHNATHRTTPAGKKAHSLRAGNKR